MGLPASVPLAGDAVTPFRYVPCTESPAVVPSCHEPGLAIPSTPVLAGLPPITPPPVTEPNVILTPGTGLPN